MGAATVIQFKHRYNMSQSLVGLVEESNRLGIAELNPEYSRRRAVLLFLDPREWVGFFLNVTRIKGTLACRAINAYHRKPVFR
jgi:hypothetical protein